MERHLWIAAALFSGTAGAATPPPTELLRCLGANLPQAVRVQAVEMTTFDRSGQERVMRGRIFGTREHERGRVMALVEYPGDLAGSAFLLREAEPASEMYVYLPAVNRVKRLAGAAMSGKLWGTDYSYNEFRHISGDFADGKVEGAGSGRLDGRAVHVLRLTPAAGDGEPYDQIQLHIDQDTCVPLQVEFRRAGAVLKRLTAPAAQLRKSGARWYAAESTLEDLVGGTRTRLRVLKVSVADKLSARYFHPQQFFSAR